MATFEDLLSMLRPELPGCPVPTVLSHANRVVRDFCAQTWVWSRWIEAWTYEGFDTIDLTPPSSQAQIIAVSRVWIDGQDMPAETTDYPGFEDGNENADVERKAYVFQPPNTLRFLYTPFQEQQLFAYAALRPTTDATEFPDFLMDHYEDGLLAGVKARLMMQPGQNWSQPELGQYYQRVYRAEIGRGRIDGLKKFSGSSVRVQPRSFI